jgi:GTP-binding protein HflX
LQEAVDADLLLHVVDASNPGFPEQMAQVQRVLHEIGAAEVPQLIVFNKLDAVGADSLPHAAQDMYELEGRLVPRIFVSARSGEGVALLRQQLATTVLASGAVEMTPVDTVELSGGSR